MIKLATNYEKVCSLLGGEDRLIFLTLEENNALEEVECILEPLKFSSWFHGTFTVSRLTSEIAKVLHWENSLDDASNLFLRLIEELKESQEDNFYTKEELKAIASTERKTREAVKNLFGIVKRREKRNLFIYEHFISFLAAATEQEKDWLRNHQVGSFLYSPEKRKAEAWQMKALTLIQARDTLVEDFTEDHLTDYLRALDVARIHLGGEATGHLQRLEDELWLALQWDHITKTKLVTN